MSEPIDELADYNRKAWDHQVVAGQRWTQPVDGETIERARRGDWKIVLTPTRPVPSAWFGDLFEAKVLCLASGGGQQVPILAAAGAQVTVLDNSPRQLEQDQRVAAREGLSIQTILGDMRDLSPLADESFDLIFHPCSNCFVPEIQSVWEESFRVLQCGGALLSGFLKPVSFVFDETEASLGNLVVRHALPYTDESHLRPDELNNLRKDGEPLMFSHSLEELVGGQLQAGFQLMDLYEDRDESEPMSKYFSPYLATRSVKPVSKA